MLKERVHCVFNLAKSLLMRLALTPRSSLANKLVGPGRADQVCCILAEDAKQILWY